MGVQINAYMQFDGQAREALDFYRSVLGGDVNLMTFGEFGMEGEAADLVMHATLTAPDVVIMASDTPPGWDVQPGHTVSMCISGEDESQLRGWFDQLADGGEVGTKLEKQMWGDIYGDCVDRYGVKWMMNVNQPQG